MGAPHGHTLHVHGHSVVHRLPAHLKVLALVAFVLVVVATPIRDGWAFAAYGLLLAVVWAASGGGVASVLRRMVVEVPFVVFALVMPFVSTGPRVTLGGVTVSEPGLYAGLGLLAKGTLGVLASVLLASTTEPRDLVAGLERLRVPTPLVAMMMFMLRYVEVVAGELRRMRIARESRGFQARGVRGWPVLAGTAGALFIRSYERGERVHLAMLSRGWSGSLPMTSTVVVGAADVVRAGAVPVAALAVLLVAVTR